MFKILVHCPLILVVRVIPNAIRKSLIVTLFQHFYLDENMFNDIEVDFFGWYR
jgi:hypothetical protein